MDGNATFLPWAVGVACTFASAQNAFHAIKVLCAAGVNRAWVGFLQRAPDDGTAVIESEWEGDLRVAQGVFPLREGRRQELRQALRSRGVPQRETLYFERTAPPNGVILIAEADDRCAEARALLAECGGRFASTRE